MLFKRNQVEEAISRAIGESSAEPSATLKARLKRLLDVDRKLAIGAVHDLRSVPRRLKEKAQITRFPSQTRAPFSSVCAC